jgi:hypothetical protein
MPIEVKVLTVASLVLLGYEKWSYQRLSLIKYTKNTGILYEVRIF